ncbi:aspartate aminotransferase family protein [Kribbella albertanoniae]|uniref:Aspartate aminotransferase family protein n=1 Tax=Kribbella albertanoniae TaxID=1266829 RepID=A0A4R4Q642_9ACTN|nr:aspartate aminotransferase family protein [Kribbella albertanoniae]TDC30681.1 aspartate aminotransferase family protein [Kribbella albertanoniae]
MTGVRPASSPRTGFGESSARALPVALVSGQGSTVFGADGRRYLDLFAGAGRCLLGHGDPSFTEAIATQTGRLVASRHNLPSRDEYDAALVELLPSGLDCLSWFSTGSEAVDTAVRLAKAATGRSDVVVFDGAFHGRTSGVVDLTDPHWNPTSQAHPGVIRCAYPTETSTPAEVDQARQQVRTALTSNPAPAAVLIEPAQATGGNRFVARQFLAWLSAVCRQTGVVLILDEVFTGFGRTGQLLLGQAADVQPGIVVLGKGMANGVPIGAVAATSAIAAAPPLSLPGGMSSTFGGNPLSAAAAAATLAALRRDDLIPWAATIGAEWLELLAQTVGNHPAVAAISGRGLMIGIQLRHACSAAEAILLDAGLVVGVSGRTLRINPPLRIDRAEIGTATDRLGSALDRILTTSETR